MICEEINVYFIISKDNENLRKENKVLKKEVKSLEVEVNLLKQEIQKNRIETERMKKIFFQEMLDSAFSVSFCMRNLQIYL